MAFRVFQIADQGAYFVILILCAFSCVSALVLRFVATRRSNCKPGAEDWFALVAVLLFLARVGFMLDCLVVINGRSLDPTIDPQSFEKVYKMIITASITTMLDQTFAKLSICALYRRIFGVNQVYRRWVYILAAAQCATCLTLVCMGFLLCRPFHKFWDWLAPGECTPWTTLLLATEPPNSLVDFGLIALAMVMIRPMQLKPNAKWKLRFLFGLGSLAGLFGFIKIGLAYNAYNPDPLYLNAPVLIWGEIHSLIGIVCCCATVYGALQPSRIWSLVVSKATACTPRFKSKHGKKNPSLPTGPRQTAPVGPYFQGEGWFHTDGYNGSTRCLVTSDARRAISHSNEKHPVDSIQVDRCVDVDYPTVYQTSEQEVDHLPEHAQPSRPSPPHLRALRGPTNI